MIINSGIQSDHRQWNPGQSTAAALENKIGLAKSGIQGKRRRCRAIAGSCDRPGQSPAAVTSRTNAGSCNPRRTPTAALENKAGLVKSGVQGECRQLITSACKLTPFFSPRRTPAAAIQGKRRRCRAIAGSSYQARAITGSSYQARAIAGSSYQARAIAGSSYQARAITGSCAREQSRPGKVRSPGRTSAAAIVQGERRQRNPE